MSVKYIIIAIAISSVTGAIAVAEGGSAPAPILTQIGGSQYENDFDKEDFDGNILIAREESRWEIRDGVLFGQPSTIEYQRTKGGHNGASPLLQVRTSGAHFCLSFRVRFDGTGLAYQGTGFGISRYASGVRMDALGTRLTADKGHLRMMHDPEFKLEAGKWYHCTFEILGDEIVVQFSGGPTLYAKHDSIYGKHGTPAEMAENGIARPIFQVKGATAGTVELDDVKIWSVEQEPAKEWASRRDKLVAAYHAEHGDEFKRLDRKETGAALKALAAKDPDWEAIQAARAAESELKKEGLAAQRKKFSELSPEEQEAIRIKKAARK